jgi:hypothetical protein
MKESVTDQDYEWHCEEAARMLLVCLDLLTVINGLRVRAMVFNATLHNISVISWWIRLKKIL